MGTFHYRHLENLISLVLIADSTVPEVNGRRAVGPGYVSVILDASFVADKAYDCDDFAVG